jgi:hypothetical protein
MFSGLTGSKAADQQPRIIPQMLARKHVSTLALPGRVRTEPIINTSAMIVFPCPARRHHIPRISLPFFPVLHSQNIQCFTSISQIHGLDVLTIVA